MAKAIARTKAETVLVLQGGGALGSYQAGVYEALEKSSIHVDWIAGISIGAINAAIIAGNAPADRLSRLRQFWWEATACGLPVPTANIAAVGAWLNEAAAAWTALVGVPGFFTPRLVPPPLQDQGSAGAVSLYDASGLRASLARFVDFDRINDGPLRLSVGAVNIETGNFTYFDSAQQRIRAEHIMASAALPPAFPPVEIDGQRYWDGGLVSNTPLQFVLDAADDRDLLIFQVDLFNARGAVPRTLFEALEREKDIRYSSRTRLNTDRAVEEYRLRSALRTLLERLPPAERTSPEALLLRTAVADASRTIVHLIYRRRAYDGHAKDYLFTRPAMIAHWAAGHEDAGRTLAHPEWQKRAAHSGTTVYDLVEGAGRQELIR
jgi:NTE family protein